MSDLQKGLFSVKQTPWRWGYADMQHKTHGISLHNTHQGSNRAILARVKLKGS